MSPTDSPTTESLRTYPPTTYPPTTESPTTTSPVASRTAPPVVVATRSPTVEPTDPPSPAATVRPTDAPTGARADPTATGTPTTAAGGGGSRALESRSPRPRAARAGGGGGGDRGDGTCPDGGCCYQVSPVPANGPRGVPFYAVPSRGLVEPGPHSSRFTPTNDRDYEVRLVRHRPRIPRRRRDAAHEEDEAPEECEETRCETSAGGANPSPGAALEGDGVG